MARRFPPPWRTDKIPGGYVVRDANGQALVYIYSRDSEAEAMQAKVLTKDEARIPDGASGSRRQGDRIRNLATQYNAASPLKDCSDRRVRVRCGSSRGHD